MQHESTILKRTYTRENVDKIKLAKITDVPVVRVRLVQRAETMNSKLPRIAMTMVTTYRVIQPHWLSFVIS